MKRVGYIVIAVVVAALAIYMFFVFTSRSFN